MKRASGSRETASGFWAIAGLGGVEGRGAAGTTFLEAVMGAATVIFQDVGGMSLSARFRLTRFSHREQRFICQPVAVWSCFSG